MLRLEDAKEAQRRAHQTGECAQSKCILYETNCKWCLSLFHLGEKERRKRGQIVSQKWAFHCAGAEDTVWSFPKPVPAHSLPSQTYFLFGMGFRRPCPELGFKQNQI